MSKKKTPDGYYDPTQYTLVHNDYLAKLRRRSDAGDGISHTSDAVVAVDRVTSERPRATVDLREWVQHKDGCSTLVWRGHKPPYVGGYFEIDSSKLCSCGLDAVLVLLRETKHDENDQSRIGQTDVVSGNPPVPQRAKE